MYTFLYFRISTVQRTSTRAKQVWNKTRLQVGWCWPREWVWKKILPVNIKKESCVIGGLQMEYWGYVNYWSQSGLHLFYSHGYSLLHSLWCWAALLTCSPVHVGIAPINVSGQSLTIVCCTVFCYQFVYYLYIVYDKCKIINRWNMTKYHLLWFCHWCTCECLSVNKRVDWGLWNKDTVLYMKDDKR